MASHKMAEEIRSMYSYDTSLLKWQILSDEASRGRMMIIALSVIEDEAIYRDEFQNEC